MMRFWNYPIYPLLSSFFSKPEKFTWWHFQNTSKEVIWTICFLNFMHGLNSAILAILQRGLRWLCPVSVALKKNINFLFQITAHRLLGHRGEHGNISHGKNKKKLKRKLIKNKNKKKATHSLNGNFKLFMYPSISCMKSRYVLLKQKNVLLCLENYL